MGNKRKKHQLTTFFIEICLKFNDNFVKSDFVFKESYFLILICHIIIVICKICFLTLSLYIALSIFKNSPDSSYGAFCPNGKSLIM